MHTLNNSRHVTLMPCDMTGTAFLTRAQRQYKSVEKMLLHVMVFEQPEPPKQWMRRKIFKLSQSRAFKNAALAIIAINSILIMCVHEGMSSSYATVLLIANYVLGLLQTAEVLIKLVAIGPRLFFFKCVHSHVAWAYICMHVRGAFDVLYFETCSWCCCCCCCFVFFFNLCMKLKMSLNLDFRHRGS